jgi:DNA polymerase-4
MTLANLRDYPQSKLVSKFGIAGFHLYSMGQLEGSWKEGFDEEPLKSIGHMYTLPAEFRQQDVLKEVLYKLCEMVGARLRVNGLMGNVVSMHLHDKEYNCAGKMHKLGHYLNDGREIYQEAMAALRSTERGVEGWQGQLYLIGITVAGLTPYASQQSLFPRDNKQRQILDALDKVNEKYEDFTLARVPAFLARDILRDSIGFGRMKEFKTSHVRGGHGRFG